MKRLCGVHQNQLVLLLVAAVVTALDPSPNLANERTSIERTYELTKYLEHQLKEIKDTYLSYLGPPFNEKDFSPPRPNSTALSLPSAATRLELWRGLENRARLAQNQRAYSVLLAAVRELARSTLCPYLQTSLLHFCTGLDGLLGSISGLMTTLGYALPPPSANTGSSGGELLQHPRKETGADGGRSRPAPLMSQSLYKARAGTRAESGQRDNQRRSGTRVVRGEREDGARRETTDKKRGKEGRRAEAAGAGGRSGGSREKGRGERGRRGRRGEPESWRWADGEEERLGEEEDEDEDEELEREGGTERWGGRRRLLSVMEDEEQPTVSESSSNIQTNNNNNNNNNQYSYNLDLLSQHQDAPREEDAVNAERGRGYLAEEERESSSLLSSSSSIRSPRSLLSPTLHPPPLSTLSLLYPFGVGEEHTLLPQPVPLSLRRGPALLSPPLSPLLSSLSSSSSSSSSSPLLSVRPTLNDFSRKVEGFWILRELQSWLWRSAKDFNRLKKRLRG
uniref:uncharacterized protein clcf1 isoform X1 n=1 Tax=Centroberyx gerrardi TaxID=166262 RepID=UPI003AACD954